MSLLHYFVFLVLSLILFPSMSRSDCCYPINWPEWKENPYNCTDKDPDDFSNKMGLCADCTWVKGFYCGISSCNVFGCGCTCRQAKGK